VSLQSLQNNNLYTPVRSNPIDPAVLYGHDGTDSFTAAQVNAMSPASGNISDDPAYASYPRDLHLTAQSPCIDRGVTAGSPATDIDGQVRPAGLGPDIGAYELAQ
jgi:hypothetical protein